MNTPLVVMDTNVLVSALLSKTGNPAKILRLEHILLLVMRGITPPNHMCCRLQPSWNCINTISDLIQYMYS